MRRVFQIALCLSVALVLAGCGPKVPDLRGMSVSAAKKAITAAGMALGGISYEEGSAAASGTVVAQVPAAGKRATDGASVALTLAGPAPVAAPVLTGLDQKGAAAAITAAGLKVGAIIESYSATIPAGALISQKPVPGADTPKGSTVDLVVSKGPEPVAVPSVIGKLEADASKILVAARFKVIASQKADKAKKGTVIAQKPASGKAQPGTSVRITVSTGATSSRPQPSLIGTWKASDGSRYTFQYGGRVSTPGGGIVVRYRLSGNNITIFYSARPASGTVKWNSAGQLLLTIQGSTKTYTRVP